MSAPTRERAKKRPGRSTGQAQRRGGGRRSRALTMLAIAGIVGLVALAILAGRKPGEVEGAQTAGSGYAYQVGEPGPGEPAPAIELPDAAGGEFSLDGASGDTVLLYFQEGLMCQPCWHQLVEIEARWGDFEQLGIDRVVTVTTDPLDALRQKVAMERITSPVLSDQRHEVSSAYDTLSYGMMGGTHNGHTFMVVARDGTIAWRADYGGAPDYTMYMPVDALLEDLRAGWADGEGAT